MKILSGAHIRQVEAATMQQQGLTGIQLMDQAAHACFEWCLHNIPAKQTLWLLCGRGNNGGDGMALARMLHEAGWPVFVHRLPGQLSTPEATHQSQLLAQAGLDVSEQFPELPRGAWVIDAMLGLGLDQPARGDALEWIERLNARPVHVIAIDLPSGMPEDPALWGRSWTAVQAEVTLALELPKRSMLVPETGSLWGRVEVVPIGLSAEAIDDSESQWFWLDRSAVRSMYRAPRPFDHKGTYGHALVVGGSHGKLGAVTLAAKAALRAGAGKVTAVVPQSGEMVLQVAVPEVMTEAVSSPHITSIPLTKAYDAIGIGPGLGTHPDTALALKLFLQEWTHPVVLDADALNILAQNPTWMAFLPPGSILTPHMGEFYRLAGRRLSELEALAEARRMALRFGVYVLLKGHRSCVSTPTGAQWFNSTGHPGLATAGSGDVLTGIITGLLARGYTPFDAATLGMYLHGAAGEAALAQQSMESMTAGDVVEALGAAWKGIA